MNQSNNSDQASRLVLGTAQLGMNYGIANQTGKPDVDQATEIVEKAWEYGIREYDTAQGYGESENVLGNALRSLSLSSEVRVLTKLDPDLDHLDKAALEQAVRGSLTCLDVPILYGLMLHREESLELWERGLGDTLQGFISKGLVRHVGVSVYSPTKALLALETEGISIVQIPGNVLDMRFERAGVFDLGEQCGKNIYIRSIFLQGLLLMAPDIIPDHMKFVAPTLKNLISFSQDVGIGIVELCIGYIKHAYPRTFSVFGVETTLQLKQNLECWNSIWPVGLVEKIQREFGDIDDVMLNPSLWPKGVLR